MFTGFAKFISHLILSEVSSSNAFEIVCFCLSSWFPSANYHISNLTCNSQIHTISERLDIIYGDVPWTDQNNSELESLCPWLGPKQVGMTVRRELFF